MSWPLLLHLQYCSPIGSCCHYCNCFSSQFCYSSVTTLAVLPPSLPSCQGHCLGHHGSCSSASSVALHLFCSSPALHFCNSICQLLHVPTHCQLSFLCFQLSPHYQCQISKAGKKGLIDGSLFIGPQIDTPEKLRRSMPPGHLTKLSSHAARNGA